MKSRWGKRTVRPRKVAWERSAIWLVAMACWLGMAAHAGAGRRLVVLPLSGPAGATFTEQILDIVEPGNTLVDQAKWKRDGGDDANTPEQLRKAAEKARVDGIISGSVQRRGMGYSLSVRVRETVTGDTVKTISLTVPTTTLSGEDEKTLRSGLLGAIRNLGSIRQLSDESSDEPPRRSARKDDRDDDRDDERASDRADDRERDRDRDRERSRSRRTLRDEEADDRDDDERPAKKSKKRRDFDDDEPSEPLPPDKRDELLVIRAGLGVSLRRLQFVTDPQLADQPQGYLGFPVVMVGAQMELFPAAKAKDVRPKLRRIGLLASYDRVLSIESRVSYRDDGGAERSVPIPTTQESFAIGAAYRWLVGKPQTGPVVQAQLRYNQLKFVFDTAVLSSLPDGVRFDVPSVTYKYLDPGMGIRLPIGATTKFLMDARLVVMMATGDLQREDQYGSTKVFGYDVDSALDFLVTKKVHIRAGFRYSRFSHTFGGNGELTNNRDNDATDIDVSGAKDAFMSGYVQSGFNF